MSLPGGDIMKKEVSQAEVSGMVSRALNLPPEVNGMANLSGQVLNALNQSPSLRMAALNGDLTSFILSQVTPEIAAQLDPAKRAEAERAKAAQTANVTSSTFAAATGGALGMGRFGAGVNGAGGRDGVNGSGRISSDSYSRELTAGAIYKALGSEGYSAAQVTTALNFAKSIGINDNSYAGYFVGASSTARNAIADYVKNGKPVSDDDVTSTGDATAVIGAVKAGKMKPEEAPASVQQIMKDMKKNGVDPATAKPKAIRKYFKEHPRALVEAKRQDALDKKDVAGLTSEQKREKVEDVKPKTVAATQAKPVQKAQVPSTTM